jgi:hypothetical protein
MTLIWFLTHYRSDGELLKFVFLSGLGAVTCFPGDVRIQRYINWTAAILTNFQVTKIVFFFSSFKVFYKSSPEDGVHPQRNMSGIMYNLTYCDFLVYELVLIIQINSYVCGMDNFKFLRS